MRTYQRPHLPALLLAATATAAVAAGQQKGPVVKLPNGGGSIRGDQLDELNVHRFLGIPFAEPPVRERRWTSPVPAKSWAPAVRSATEWAPNCMQLDPPAWPTMAKNVSEDCLYLNVFSPAPMDEQQQSLRYPVLVWIHGGGYAYGGAHDSELDGTQLADLANVVVVTIQYRLDVFGWLGSNSLRSRSEDNSTGNWGIQDQRLALKWVKQNIDAFNGNSSQVMIFGESAGVSAEATRLRCPACIARLGPACLPAVGGGSHMVLAGCDAGWRGQQPCRDAEELGPVRASDDAVRRLPEVGSQAARAGGGQLPRAGPVDRLRAAAAAGRRRRPGITTPAPAARGGGAGGRGHGGHGGRDRVPREEEPRGAAGARRGHAPALHRLVGRLPVEPGE
jgi:hypothetical protein